jgi:hypothetical protein
MIDLEGAVDLYVHSSPDLLPRQCDDLELARVSSAAGLRAVLHRHHFSLTTERAVLARTATSFEMLGGAVLNEHVGGLSPLVAETALRCGARWIGMPTLSAAAFRQRLAAGSPGADVLRLGPGNLTLTDADGSLKHEVRDILDLAAERQVAVGMGYGTFAECLSLTRGAADAGIEHLVLTYPDVMGLSDAEIVTLAEHPGVFLELCAFTMHPQGFTPDLADGLRERALGWLRTLGPGRLVASSDGGMAGIPGTVDLLTWLVGWLEQCGLDKHAIDTMVRANPARILRL